MAHSRLKDIVFKTLCTVETDLIGREGEQTANWRRSSKHLMTLNVLISGKIMHGGGAQ